MICTFIGNSIIYENIKNDINETIVYVIKNFSVDTFLVGDWDDFNIIVYNELIKIRGSYPNIKVILTKKTEKRCENRSY